MPTDRRIAAPLPRLPVTGPGIGTERALSCRRVSGTTTWNPLPPLVFANERSPSSSSTTFSSDAASSMA
jgi:hypothetical protein